MFGEMAILGQSGYTSHIKTGGSVGLSAETGHDFYDNLSFIDWRAIRLELEPELENSISAPRLHVVSSALSTLLAAVQ